MQSYIKLYIRHLNSVTGLNSENDYRRLKKLEEMQRQQSKCLAAMLNHQITGNGIDNMKKIRDELLESIIEK